MLDCQNLLPMLTVEAEPEDPWQGQLLTWVVACQRNSSTGGHCDD